MAGKENMIDMEQDNKETRYNVRTLREAGLEAKWTHLRNGAPMLVARKPGTKTWYYVDLRMWQAMQREGIAAAFERFTLLGDIFSVPA